MTIRDLNARLDRIEEKLRKRYLWTLSEPKEPHAVVTWAARRGRVTDKQLDAMWDQVGPLIRAEGISQARRRRETRSNPEDPENEPWLRSIPSHPLIAAAEVLSYPRQEDPGLELLTITKTFSRIRAKHLILNDYDDDDDAAVVSRFLQNVHGIFAARLLGTPDGIELRREIWEQGG